MGTLKAVLSDDTGATAVEYGLLIGMLAMVIAVGVQGFTNSLFKLWDFVDAQSRAAAARGNP